MKSAFTVTLAAALLTLPTFAQEPQIPGAPGAQKEHQWLKQFAGEWTSVSKAMGPSGEPVMESSGSMKSHMVGDLWVVNTMRGDVNGVTFDALQTIGYDATKKKYVGTWIDSMMNHMWHYEGTVDASGKKLVLDTTGPNFMTGKLAKYRDNYEFKSPDLIIATSELQGEDGQWLTFMTAEVKRKKP